MLSIHFLYNCRWLLDEEEKRCGEQSLDFKKTRFESYPQCKGETSLKTLVTVKSELQSQTAMPNSFFSRHE